MVFQVYRNWQSNVALRNARPSRSPANRISRGVELLLHIVVVGLAAAIVGTASHVLSSYNNGLADYNMVWLALWPSLVNGQTTKVLIGTASAIVFLNLLAVFASFIPRLNRLVQPRLSALCLVAFSTLSALLAISALAVTTTMEANRGEQDTFKSWTCKFRSSINSFGTLCTESHFAYYAMIPILAISVILVALGIGRLSTSKQAAVATPVAADKSSDY